MFILLKRQKAKQYEIGGDKRQATEFIHPEA